MIPYLLYNYSMQKDGVAIDALTQAKLIEGMVGIEVAYRKKNPLSIDKDTCIVTPKKTRIDIGDNVVAKALSFCVARHITTRGALKWDRSRDAIDRVDRVTDEDVLGFVFLLPEYGKLAVADRTGETYLNASSTLGRLRAIIQSKKGFSISFSTASSGVELGNALKAWELSEFSFTARPFNPSVSRQGQKVHDVLFPNNAKLQGKIVPNKGTHLEYNGENGIMWEIVGLAEKGYAEYGTKGTTKDGQAIQIVKTSPTSGKPPIIKIFLDGMASVREAGKVLARALLDIHGKK